MRCPRILPFAAELPTASLLHSRVNLLDGTSGVLWARDVVSVSAVEQTSHDNLQEVRVGLGVGVEGGGGGGGGWWVGWTTTCNW